MPRFACPKCRAVLSTEDRPGAIVTCEWCGKRLKLPALKTASEDPDSDVLSSAPPPLPDFVKISDSESSRGQSAEEVLFDKNDDERQSNAQDNDATDKGPAANRKPEKPQKTSLLAGVGGGIFALLAVALFLIIISGRWVNWLQRPIQDFLVEQGIHPILAVVVAAGIILIPVCLLWLHWVKSTIVSSMPGDIDFKAAKATEFEELDPSKLAKCTAAFEGLGFHTLMDYTIEADVDMSGAGFGRLLVNDKRHCFAEINQVFAATGRAVPMRCMIISLFEDGWSAAITNRLPSKEGYLMRLPRAVWRSFPDAEPAELFEKFTKLRGAMMDDLPIRLIEDDTAQAYFAREKVNTRARKQAVARRWALSIQIEFWRFDRNPKRQWLGEYARKAKK